LDEFLGGADLFFEFCQFFLQETESVHVAGYISFDIKSCLLLVEGLALLSDVGFQRSLGAACFYSLFYFLHFYPEEWEIAGWLEIDLQRLRELGFYLLEDILYFAGVIN
jgi:hypothetical protein